MKLKSNQLETLYTCSLGYDLSNLNAKLYFLSRFHGPLNIGNDNGSVLWTHSCFSITIWKSHDDHNGLRPSASSYDVCVIFNEHLIYRTFAVYKNKDICAFRKGHLRFLYRNFTIFAYYDFTPILTGLR